MFSYKYSILYFVLNFRWKGENVSTAEVSDVVGMLDFVQDANVYGVLVPGMSSVLSSVCPLAVICCCFIAVISSAQLFNFYFSNKLLCRTEITVDCESVSECSAVIFVI